MTREDILRAMLTGHLGSAAAVFAAAECLAGVEIKNQSVATAIGLSFNFTRRNLYALRDAGLLRIEPRARGLVLTTTLPSAAPALPGGVSVGSLPLPSQPPDSAPPVPTVSASDAVARLARPVPPPAPLPEPAPELPLPLPPPAPRNGGDPSPDETADMVAAMRAELAPLTGCNVTDGELRTLALMYRDSLDLPAECNVFATWLSNASSSAKDRSSRSAAKKLAEIAAGKRSWFAALRDHLERSPRRRGHARGAAAAPRGHTVAPRRGPPAAELDAAWAKLDQSRRDYFLMLAKLTLERNGHEITDTAIHQQARLELWQARQRQRERGA